MRSNARWQVLVVVFSCLVISACAEKEVTVNGAAPFSSDYFTARTRFRDKVEQAQGRLITLELDATGPAGETLGIDVAWFGAEEPRRALLHCSGLHGVEGFAGSAIQLQFLEDGIPPIPEDAAIVLVHVLNPYGMAWLRRVNENNVDLNRNFLSPDECYEGAPPHYAEFDRFFNPPSPPARDFFYARAGWLLLRHGMSNMKQTVVGGQYEYPQGLFFGGERLEEGPQKWQDFVTARLATIVRLVVVRVHTGLDAFKEDTLHVDPRFKGSPAYHEIRNAFPGPVEFVAKGGVYRIRSGHYTMFPRALPTATMYVVVQEFGTYGPVKVLHALREENRWHHYGDDSIDHPTKRKLKETFSPNDDDWRQSVLVLGRGRLGQAMQLAFGPAQ